MNWLVIIVVGIFALALITFLVWRNVKDRQRFEDQLNQDYHKPRDEEGDIEIDQKLK